MNNFRPSSSLASTSPRAPSAGLGAVNGFGLLYFEVQIGHTGSPGYFANWEGLASSSEGAKALAHAELWDYRLETSGQPVYKIEEKRRYLTSPGGGTFLWVRARRSRGGCTTVQLPVLLMRRSSTGQAG